VSPSDITIEGIEVPTGHLIGGVRVGGGAPIPVHSPIDGSYLGDIPNGGQTEVQAAVRAARQAFPGWAALGPDGRGRLLDRFADLIQEHELELGRVGTAENGALLPQAPSRGRPRAAENIAVFANWARHLRHELITGLVVDNQVHWEPAGVAALIVPWNAPLMLGTWKIGPALAAGNTVVVKPPEWAPYALSMVGELALDAGIPPGVLNIVQGLGEDTGAALVALPDVDRISFTGSPDTARLIAAAAAPNLTPLSFELGGKSPFLVLEDADLGLAARHVTMQFANAGQVCLAGTRLLVHSAVVDELIERVIEHMPQMVVGDPREPGTRIGPLIHPQHFARVQGFVERALAQGARPIFGGRPHPRGGLYFEPTLLDNVRQDAEIVQREVFGPVLTLQTFDDEDEAVELANGTHYGLAAILFSRDSWRAHRVGARLVAGTVWVNCYFQRDLAAPFGGARQSGIGREGGTWSFDFFCDVKNLSIRRGSLNPEPAGAW
jgi:acyl-CoA reductase-like NAD-dependent aldehyde dehydrogenase